MPSTQNISELEKIQVKKNAAKSVVFAHYRGLGVNQLNELRQKVRDAGGEMLVTKNTLLRIAFGDEKLNDALVGPTAAVFAYEDEIAPIKVIADFQKEKELPTFTGGFMDNKALAADQVVQLAKLPGKLQMQAILVGTLAAPLSGMVNVLQGNLRNLVYALKAIHDQKSN